MKKTPDTCSTIREIDATPYASALVEGHRDFGYSLETALADIIDNAISAGAREIELITDTTSDDPWIALRDDGRGMTERELVEAMRLGSKNPTDERAAEDLGRFGLGLKSASFSQCRRLTVLSVRQGKMACARWDLDRIAKRNDWSLELPNNLNGVTGHDLLPGNGTVVVWGKLDRLSGGNMHDGAKRTAHMNAELAGAERHLQRVFHRFLEGATSCLKLSINGRPLKPIDPMATCHPSTQKDPEEILPLDKGDVRIRCYTLPHHSRMSRAEWEEIGGQEGHLKSQGLYVYRENRLIIAGSWLGLARQAELTKLCRIAVDIPNTMDAEWKIDVKKASAQLPPLVRERLKKIVERFVGTSKRTYLRRGQMLVDGTRFPIWNRLKKDGQIVFRPNHEHPVFRTYAERLPTDLQEGFERCLRLVGAGLPIETLHAEFVGNAEAVAPDMANENDLEELVFSLANALMENGVAVDAISETLRSYSYLRSNWGAVSRIIDDLCGMQTP